jgi:hypothetical protein
VACFELEDRGVEVTVPESSRIFTYPYLGPTYLSNAYWGFLPRGCNGRGVKLNTPPNVADVNKTPSYAFMT